MIGIAIATMDGLTKAVWNISDFAVPSAEPQNPLGNGRIWGHPKPRQGGFAKCHPQSLPPLVFLQLEAGTHCIIFVLIATLKVRARPHEVLPVVSLYEIDTQSAPETSLLRQTWIQPRPNQHKHGSNTKHHHKIGYQSCKVCIIGQHQ